MGSKIRAALIVGLAMAFAVSLALPALAAGNEGKAPYQSFTGTITKDGKLQTSNGQQYELKGKLAREAAQHKGERVQITGSVKENGKTPEIEVSSFQRLGSESGGMEQQGGMQHPSSGSSSGGAENWGGGEEQGGGSSSGGSSSY